MYLGYMKMIYFLVIINLYQCQHYNFFGVIICMESNQTNLKLLYLGQINQKWLLSCTRTTTVWTVSIIR